MGQNAQQEINDQVWKPFILSFNNRDTKGFMEVHSRDVVRSSIDSKRVLNWKEYHDQTLESEGRKNQGKRQLELRFIERIASADLAVEVGIYKTSYIPETGAPRSFYGKFHAVLRKESGTWKILVDMDSSEQNSIGEEDFLAASPLE